MNISYYTTSAFAAISAALLIHRARQKPPVPSPKSPLQRLTILSNNLIQKYQSLHPRLAHDIQNNILKRVDNRTLTPENGLLALKVMLIAERTQNQNNTSSNTMQDALSTTLIHSTISDLHILQHSNRNIEPVYRGVMDGKPQLFEGIQIGNYFFTTENQIHHVQQDQNDQQHQHRNTVNRMEYKYESQQNSQPVPLSNKNKSNRSAIEVEQDALMNSFRLRRSSISSPPPLSSDQQFEEITEVQAYRSYLFAHLKSEVIVLDKAGLAFISREVDQMSMYTSEDPFRGFRKAHQVIKRIVVTVISQTAVYNSKSTKTINFDNQNQPGQRWQLGDSYSIFLSNVPQYQLSQLWDAMRRLVICYDNLPNQKKSSLTEIELMENLPHIILIARHARVAMGIRSLLRNSYVAPSPAHRERMRAEARQLANLHGQHVQSSNDILRRANSSKGGMNRRRRRRPSLDDSSVTTFREQRALRITTSGR